MYKDNANDMHEKNVNALIEKVNGLLIKQPSLTDEEIYCALGFVSQQHNSNNVPY